MVSLEDMDRWEHGSDHHWVPATSPTVAVYPWSEKPHNLYGTGRYALNGILDQIKPKRLWIPSFYCSGVIVTVPDKRLQIATYRELPTDLVPDISDLPVEPGDAVIVQNIYGLRAKPPRVPAGVPVIEDHTHDPQSAWAHESQADYCFTSLRKLYPVGDGGVAWAPTGKPLPPEPPLDPAHVVPALDRLTGILLKAAYLEGGAIDKAVYRAHHVRGERTLTSGPISTLLPLTRACLPGFPIAAWRAAREANFAAFARVFGTQRGATLLLPEPGATAFIATLVFDSRERRDRVRQTLISEHDVFPVILWPMQGEIYDVTYEVPAEAAALAHRVLSLHCDHRYTPADLERVARAVIAALA